jgi:hypothetical protein
MLGVHMRYGLSSAAALCNASDHVRELQFIKAIRKDLNMHGKFDVEDRVHEKMTQSFATGIRYAISGSSI